MCQTPRTRACTLPIIYKTAGQLSKTKYPRKSFGKLFVDFYDRREIFEQFSLRSAVEDDRQDIARHLDDAAGSERLVVDAIPGRVYNGSVDLDCGFMGDGSVLAAG